jgi:glycosyltransferase involved in cell wall biosynthesis
VADELAAGWGIRATVIPNGVDAERFAAAACADPAAATARRRWRDRIGAPYVLAVGGIEPRKGSIDLAEAFALFAVAHPRHRLVMAGGETLFDYRPYRAAFDDRCAVLGLEPMLLGPVDDADLPSLVAGADVFAFPSTREGFGLAAMEALAAGVPVVARDLPVFREVFGRAALLGASPAEMAALLSEAVEGPSDERAAAGRSLAAGLTWDDAAAAHLAWYGRHVASTVWKVSR